MDRLKRISKIFHAADEITFGNSSRIVLMSDIHRGDGDWADNFLKNQNLYFAALTHYYNRKYTYIEIGDGDELWENKKLSDIKEVHSDVFWLLAKFYNKHRLYMLYGNHDMVKKNKKFVEDNLSEYYDERERKYLPLFPGIKLHEGLVLKHKYTGRRILLIHGHQVDYLNDQLWKLARFLVRHLWRPLELHGVNDPTSTAKNYDRKGMISERLTEWVVKEKHMLVAGHNHKPSFPKVGDPPYFNDGSGVHPRCITAIEISCGYILLVKWSAKTKSDGTLYIGRDVLAGPKKVTDYFKTL